MSKYTIITYKVLIKILQEIFVFIPLTLFITNFDPYIQHDNYPIIVIILLTVIIYIIGIIIGVTFNNKINLLKYGIILIITVSLALLLWKLGYMWVSSFILIGVYLYRGSVIWYENTYSIYYIVSILTYCLMAFLIRKNVALESYDNYVIVLGIITLLIALFNLNSNEIKSADPKNKGLIYSEVKRYNKYLVIIVTMIIFLVSCGYTLISTILLYVKTAVYYILMLIQNLFTRNNEYSFEDGLPKGPSPLPRNEELNSEGLLGQIMYYFFVVVVSTLGIIGCIYIIIKLYNIIKKFANSIICKMMMNENIEFSYEEEKENLMDIEKFKRQYVDAIKNKMEQIFRRSKNWNELTNVEKIREMYKAALDRLNKKGYKSFSNLTPYEVVEDTISKEYEDQLMNKEFVEVYNEARYSHHKIKDSQVNNYVNELNKK